MSERFDDGYDPQADLPPDTPLRRMPDELRVDEKALEAAVDALFDGKREERKARVCEAKTHGEIRAMVKAEAGIAIRAYLAALPSGPPAQTEAERIASLEPPTCGAPPQDATTPRPEVTAEDIAWLKKCRADADPHEQAYYSASNILTALQGEK